MFKGKVRKGKERKGKERKDVCEKERNIGEAEMMTMLSSCVFVVWGGVGC